MLDDARDITRLRLAAGVLLEISETAAIKGVIAVGREGECGLAATNGTQGRSSGDTQSTTQARTPPAGAPGSNERQAAGVVRKAEWEGMDTAAQEEWVRQHCFDCQHASGSCRMGAPTDARSVVDSGSGKVLGGLSGKRLRFCYFKLAIATIVLSVCLPAANITNCQELPFRAACDRREPVTADGARQHPLDGTDAGREAGCHRGARTDGGFGGGERGGRGHCGCGAAVMMEGAGGE